MQLNKCFQQTWCGKCIQFNVTAMAACIAREGHHALHSWDISSSCSVHYELPLVLLSQIAD
jgi:hypothetical protein